MDTNYSNQYFFIIISFSNLPFLKALKYIIEFVLQLFFKLYKNILFLWMEYPSLKILINELDLIFNK